MSLINDRYRTFLEFIPDEKARNMVAEYKITIVVAFIGCIGCSSVFESRTPDYGEEDGIRSDASAESDAGKDVGTKPSGDTGANGEDDSGTKAPLDVNKQRDSESNNNINTQPEAGECRIDSDCPKSRPVCSARRQCVQCESNFDCKDDLGCKDYECVEYTPGCGNGVLDVELDEHCDDGNNEPGDGCGPDCRAVECKLSDKCVNNIFACVCGDGSEWCVSNQLGEPDHRAGCMKKCVTDEDCPSFTICSKARACSIPCDTVVPNGCPPGLKCRKVMAPNFDDPGAYFELIGCGL